MRRLSSIILLAVCTVALFVSCSNKATDIKVGEDSIAFDIKGGEKFVAVTADGTYDIEGCTEWVKSKIDGDSIVFTVEENTSGAKRDCVVKLTGNGDVAAEIKISQADKCTFLKVSETEVALPKEGGSKDLTVETDGTNITANASNGITASIAGNKLNISAPANQGDAIKGEVTVGCDTISAKVKVTIEGSMCQRCGGKGKIACTRCGGKGYTSDAGGSGTHEMLIGCSKCGGSGSDWVLDFIHKGSGRMTCPDCHGTGH